MNETKATRYQRLRRRAHAADLAAGAALIAVLALTPAARGLADWAHRMAAGLPAVMQAPVAAAMFVGLAALLWEAVAIPAVLYLGLRVDRKFKAADHSVEGLLAAQAQTALVGLPAALLAAGIVMVAVRLAGPWWWPVAGAALALALVGAVRVTPTLLVRVGSARPIARRSLMGTLRELARRSDVPLSDILEWQLEDGARATAVVTGLGRTRRVFIASEVVRDWTDDEIAVVVAHELAHHVHRDLWQSLALNAGLLSAGLCVADRALALLSASLGLGGPGDLAALPFMALVTGAVWLLATPVRHAQSRDQERRADQFALRLTGEADAFGAAIRRLSARHLAEERPAPLTRWLFHRHPSVAERLALADAFRESISSLRR